MTMTLRDKESVGATERERALASVLEFQETRVNTGHAVLQSTPKPPRMRRGNGPTDGRIDKRTDGQTLL